VSIAGLPRVLVRRWYATVAGLLILAALVGAAMTLVPAKYEASADVVILPPPTKGPNGSLNPYLELGGLDGVTDVLAKSMQDPNTVDALQRSGVTGTFSVGPDATSSGALILVSVTAKTAQAAITSRNVVVAALAPTLLKLQTVIEVPTAYRVTIRTVRADDTASVVRKSQIRATIAAAAIGLLITVGLALCSDALANRRRRRRAPTDGEPGHRRPRPPTSESSADQRPPADEQRPFADDERLPARERQQSTNDRLEIFGTPDADEAFTPDPDRDDSEETAADGGPRAPAREVTTDRPRRRHREVVPARREPSARHEEQTAPTASD
jgi:hypothetical protein